MSFDIDQLRLKSGTFQVPSKIVIERNPSERFIKGPIPIPWLVRAASLPGKYTLRTALVIFYVQGFEQSKKFMLDRFHFDLFGIKKDSARRSLERLRQAGLIGCVKVGRKFRVTVHDYHERILIDS